MTRRLAGELRGPRLVVFAFIFFCALVAFIVFLVAGAKWAEEAGTYEGDTSGPGFVALLSLAGTSLLLFAAWYFREASAISLGFSTIDLGLRESERGSEISAGQVSDSHLRELLEFNQQEARKYHANAQRQAQQAFRISQGAMLFGLMVLLIGAVLTLLADTAAATISVASLSAVATAISGYVGATFLRSYGMSVAQTYRYFQQPLVTGFILLADRMTQDITDDAKKNEAHAAIAAEIVQGAFGLFATAADRKQQA